MSEQGKSDRTISATPQACGEVPGSLTVETSRRHLLMASAGLAAGGAAAQMLPAPAMAQDTADAELGRLQRQRRILLKGGVVLTLDRQAGDFAQADVLIEDSKIREVRPNIAVSDDVAVVDAANRIVIPGFIDTHSHSYQGILRNILSNGRVDPDYNRDIVGTLTPAFTPADAYAGMRATALGMIDMGTTGVVDVSQVNNTPEHSDALIPRAPGFRHPGGLRLFGRQGPGRTISARYRAAAANLFQLKGPVADARFGCWPGSQDVRAGARGRRPRRRACARRIAPAQ
jgi:hypothetical protein